MILVDFSRKQFFKNPPQLSLNFINPRGSWTKCLKNKPFDVIKMREMKGEVEKETPKKEMDNPSFL